MTMFFFPLPPCGTGQSAPKGVTPKPAPFMSPVRLFTMPLGGPALVQEAENLRKR